MKKKHNLISVLRRVKSVEGAFADLYRDLSALYPLDEEMSFMLYRMSVEEKGHEALVDYCIRVFQAMEKPLVPEIEFEFSVLEDLLVGARALLVNAQKRELSDQELLDEVLRLEVEVGEHALRMLPAQSIGGPLPHLVEALTSRDHTEKVTRLGTSRGFVS